MSITTIIGPMFSGKTTELIRLIDRKRISGKKCLIIKHKIDIRFGTDKNITTHGNIIYDKCDIDYVTDIMDLDNIKRSLSYDVIGIEEGHFFDGIFMYCNKLANDGLDIIVSTLDGSFQQILIKHEIGDLIATSEKVIKISAICMYCLQENASFTIRTIESNETILVGDRDIYKCACRKCLNKFKNINH